MASNKRLDCAYASDCEQNATALKTQLSLKPAARSYFLQRLLGAKNCDLSCGNNLNPELSLWHVKSVFLCYDYQIEDNVNETSLSEARVLPRYRLSFGTGGFHLNEAIGLARIFLDQGDWDRALSMALAEGIFPSRRESTAKRMLREIGHKVRELDAQELEWFVAGDRDEQAALLWAATCRAYRFVAEFADEVVGRLHKSYIPDVSYDDFDAFFERKAEWADELLHTTNSTRHKLRAVLFRLMREADIISSENRINSVVLSAQLENYWQAQGSSTLSVFPLARRY